MNGEENSNKGCLVGVGNAMDSFGKGSWKSGPFGCYGDCEDLSSVPCRTCLIGPCLQFMFTSRYLGFNPLLCCCCYFCCNPCAVCHQRKIVRERTELESQPVWDCLMSCCCSDCAVLQNANQIGEEVTYDKFKFSELFTAPTQQDMNNVKDSVKK